MSSEFTLNDYQFENDSIKSIEYEKTFFRIRIEVIFKDEVKK